MKLRHVTIGLAIIGATATADAYTCKSRVVNKGGITAEFKLETHEPKVKGKTVKRVKDGTLYLQTGEKLLVVSLPGPLVDDVLKKEGNLAGVVFANAKIAIERYNKKKNVAQQWKCAEKPAELPAVEEETPAAKPPKGDDLIIPPEKPGTEKPSPPKASPPKPTPAGASDESPGFGLSARDWEDARNRKVWLSFDVKKRPNSALAILDKGKPWGRGRMDELSKLAKSYVKDAYNRTLKRNPYAVEGTLNVKLAIDPEGYVKTIRIQGACEKELIDWILNIFNKMVFTPNFGKSPQFDFVLNH